MIAIQIKNIISCGGTSEFWTRKTIFNTGNYEKYTRPSGSAKDQTTKAEDDSTLIFLEDEESMKEMIIKLSEPGPL